MPSYTLNQAAVTHARNLIDRRQVDTETGWSEGQATADEGNTEIDSGGYAAYGRWFLGIDPDASEDTKGRYHFPYGDFSKVFRQGLIAAESRAAQNDDDAIARAAKQLLDHLDEKYGIDKS